MPAYADAAGFALAGWILFFFAAAIGSGNFPGEVSNFRSQLKVALISAGHEVNIYLSRSHWLPNCFLWNCRSRVARTSTRCRLRSVMLHCDGQAVPFLLRMIRAGLYLYLILLAKVILMID
jgi:hypothetical protein